MVIEDMPQCAVCGAKNVLTLPKPLVVRHNAQTETFPMCVECNQTLFKGATDPAEVLARVHSLGR